ncbi:hypothetical protein Bca101_029879 [Brassica carinata]
MNCTTLVRTGPGSEPEEKCCFLPCIRRREDQGPFLTPEEEERLFEEQVENNQGFDINFEEFSCVFNYVPVDFDENYYFKDTDTTRGVIDRLSRDSLGLYNERMGKGYEFVEVIKANTHPTGTAAHIFYITFRAKEPPDDQPKDFQARKEDVKKVRRTHEFNFCSAFVVRLVLSKSPSSVVFVIQTLASSASN